MSSDPPLPVAATRGSPQFKVCCIASREEAALAIAHGATALGLVSAMPSGPGVIPPATIAELLADIPTDIATFLLTSRQSTAALVAQQHELPATTLQLVDHVPPRELRALRRALPAVTLVQVIHVTGREAIEQALAAAPLVDAILLDSGNPAASVKELGGTGRVHDWAISARIRERAGVPVWLAGGLHAGNVADAIAIVRPHGVDVCSGVRTEGQLDPVRLGAFAAAIGRGGASTTRAAAR